MSNLTEPDAAGNRIDGNAIINKSRDCYVHSNQRMIAVLGMQNALIIDTPDALLIADKSHVQDVKEIYAQLKKENHDAHKIHQTVFRPWGTYTVLEEGPHFKIKRIVVKPHSSLSLQSHEHRNEHWVVVEGAATVTNGQRTFTVNTNESTYIPAGNKHRLENTTNEPLAIIEVQSGNYLGEDDIVRFNDQYGRS
jgi:mannose-1-phosphate guanylyltransferase